MRDITILCSTKYVDIRLEGALPSFHIYKYMGPRSPTTLKKGRILPEINWYHLYHDDPTLI